MSIEEAGAYQVDSDRLIVRVVLSKSGETKARVHLRWEVANQEYTQASESIVIIEKELEQKSVALVLESQTDIDVEDVTRSEVQIGHGAPGTDWTSAPFKE
ncbi:hypothetical protein U4E84_15035 [Halorubrum sp. AD140]|uniref:hypothetical protein n=1 Tax=Halorubrum sp. AD140 TaxID=3050073 RepID=UPI002ACC8176|nr:hypothetical protein [Halorubrum sp. AD140]MDZ5812660.1 hypothetical protein [Halorubrum sp. AD140]